MLTMRYLQSTDKKFPVSPGGMICYGKKCHGKMVSWHFLCYDSYHVKSEEEVSDL